MRWFLSRIQNPCKGHYDKVRTAYWLDKLCGKKEGLVLISEGLCQDHFWDLTDAGIVSFDAVVVALAHERNFIFKSDECLSESADDLLSLELRIAFDHRIKTLHEGLLTGHEIPRVIRSKMLGPSGGSQSSELSLQGAFVFE